MYIVHCTCLTRMVWTLANKMRNALTGYSLLKVYCHVDCKPNGLTQNESLSPTFARMSIPLVPLSGASNLKIDITHRIFHPTWYIVREPAVSLASKNAKIWLGSRQLHRNKTDGFTDDKDQRALFGTQILAQSLNSADKT